MALLEAPDVGAESPRNTEEVDETNALGCVPLRDFVNGTVLWQDHK